MGIQKIDVCVDRFNSVGRARPGKWEMVGLRVSDPQHAKTSEEQKDSKGHREAVRDRRKRRSLKVKGKGCAEETGGAPATGGQGDEDRTGLSRP